MKKIIYEYIQKEAEKLAKEFHSYHNVVEIEFQRNRRRITSPPPKVIKVPEYWKNDRKFNPFYVLKHLRAISNSVFKKLERGNYTPNPPYDYKINSPTGKRRNTTVYQIPDAAVSNYLYRRLLSKNKHRFSSLSYAYRDDRNVHYAIQDISLELRNSPRIFVVEFDFKDFFGSIDHAFLFEQLDRNGYSVSDFERRLIESFISLKKKGIALGTSISLFLANAVCWQLDRNLENEGLRFARYADDIVIWSKDYQKTCRAFEIISVFSQASGIDINLLKSDGISLLQQKEMRSEFNQTKEYIEFLGYSLSWRKVSIKKASVLRIKRHIAYLLYRNLIQPINASVLSAVTIPNNDKDANFVTAIMQIRRYLYGNLNEEIIARFLKGTYKRLRFRGVMSFYPLIDDEDQLRELDGWLLSSIWLTLRRRQQLFARHGHNLGTQFPFNLSKSDLLQVCRERVYMGKTGMLAIPSFLRIYRAIKKGVQNEGIEETMNPRSLAYNYT